MSHTLPEAKRAKADRRRRHSKRELKMKRAKERTTKYAFVHEFSAESEPAKPNKVANPETLEK